VDEYVLLFGLDEKVALIADVTQKAANIYFIFTFDLF
jgi:hypothetical protein